MTLYPRRTHGNTHDGDAHLRAKAHRLLDRAMVDDTIPEHMIRWALKITGDLT